jgi:hypothetical protein
VSGIRVTLGDADVSLAAHHDAYDPRDLCDATCAALLAVNTPDTVRWAHALYQATADNPRPTPKET